MKVLIQIAIFSLAGLTAARTYANPLPLPQTFPIAQAANTASTSGERVLVIDYDVACTGENSADFPGIQGTVQLAAPVPGDIRFELWAGAHQQRISLGSAQSEFMGSILISKMQASKNCTLTRFEARMKLESLEPTSIHSLAEKYSPYLIVRNDQILNRETDVPLAMIYSLQNDTPTHKTLRYTIVFSDEDSMKDSHAVEGQNIRYGRTTDVEWIYEVSLNERFEVISRRLQKSTYYKIAHPVGNLRGDHATAELAADARLWPNSEHVILYNVGANNVFSEKGKGDQTRSYLAYHLSVDEDHFVASPFARESFQFSPQGLFSLNCARTESVRERKAPDSTPDQTLYLDIEASLSPSSTFFNLFNGKIRPKIKLFDHTTGELVFETDHLPGSIDRIGSGMYGKKEYSAIPLNTVLIDRLNEGGIDATLEFENATKLMPHRTKLQVSSIHAFTLQWNSQSQKYEIAKKWNWEHQAEEAPFGLKQTLRLQASN